MLWNAKPHLEILKKDKFTSKIAADVQQTTFINIFSLSFRENKTWCFKWIMKSQALFSSKDKSKQEGHDGPGSLTWESLEPNYFKLCPPI